MSNRSSNAGPAFGSLWRWRYGIATYMGLGEDGLKGHTPRYMRPPLLNLSTGEIERAMSFARLENDGTYPTMSGWDFLGMATDE